MDKSTVRESSRPSQLTIRPRKRHSTAVTCFQIIFILTFLFLIIYYFSSSWLHKPELKRIRLPRYMNVKPGYLVHTQTCKIPNIDPWSPDVVNLIDVEEEENCTKRDPLTTVIKNSKTNSYSLKINKDQLYYYRFGPVCCCYHKILRKHHDEIMGYSKNCTTIQSTMLIPKSTDHIYVVCKSIQLNRVVYKNVHTFIHERPSITKRIEKFRETWPDTETPPVSVLMVGIGSVSRLNLIRTMPNTAEFLYKNKWFEMTGYNKVEETSFSNLMALLTGLDSNEAFSRCFNKSNDCPFIWSNFQEKGYVTAFGEDGAGLGTLDFFNNPFFDPPTDYFIRPLILNSENRFNLQSPEIIPNCIGFSQPAEFVFKFASDFTKAYSGKPYYGLFWTKVSASFNGLSDPLKLDTPTKSFFEDLEKNGVFNESIVIFFSDHGVRFGHIMRYPTGWLENRLPFMFISIPPFLKEKHPEFVNSLKINQNRLTTPFDLHLTLKDIVRLSGPIAPVASSACPNCHSLFKEVAINRTCEAASIAPNYCTCQMYYPINRRRLIVRRAITLAIGHINNVIRMDPLGQAICAQHKLQSIDTAMQTSPESGYVNLLVTFRTSPSDAEFQATLRVDLHNFGISIVGPITRLNTYLESGKCINDRELKKLCACY